MSLLIEAEHPKQTLTQAAFPRPAFLRFWQRKTRIHRYQAADAECDFMFTANAECDGEHIMTACRSGVRKNDIIRIDDSHTQTSYRVLEIDYYADPADMWTARLTNI